jgi:hypothetical protein
MQVVALPDSRVFGLCQRRLKDVDQIDDRLAADNAVDWVLKGRSAAGSGGAAYPSPSSRLCWHRGSDRD